MFRKTTQRNGRSLAVAAAIALAMPLLSTIPAAAELIAPSHENDQGGDEQALCDGVPDEAVVSDPYSCTTYYVCSKGVPQKMVCPPGTQFSLIDRECGPAWQVKCDETPELGTSA